MDYPLYMIDSALRAILDGFEVVDEETGEILGADAIEQLQMDRKEKMENIGCYVKNLASMAASIKAEEKALKDRRTAIESKVERLKEYLLNSITESGEKGFKGVRCVMTCRNTPSVDITDLDAIPEQFRRIIPETYEADKNAIKAAINDGTEVPGARIVIKTSMTIK